MKKIHIFVDLRRKLRDGIYHFLTRIFFLLDDSTEIEKKIKVRILKYFGAKVGINVGIARNVLITGGPTGAWKNLKIGNNVVISKGVVINPRGGLEIGNNVMIGYSSIILTSNHNIPPKKDIIQFSGHTLKKVVLENNSWIASNVTVLPGVVIGEGAVAGAGSVVTKNIPPNIIAAGNPAKKIKCRE